MGGMPRNAEPDHPMSNKNPDGPEYEDIDIDDNKKGSVSQPSINGNLTNISELGESLAQPPSIPVKRKTSCHTNQPPPVPASRRPSGAIETLAMGIFQLNDQQLPRKVSIDGGRVNYYPQGQEKPKFLPRARRASEHGEPSTSLPEETTPSWTHTPTILGQGESVYVNAHVQSSEITDPSSCLPERDLPQTTNPVTISEQRERQPAVAKIPMESHDEGADDITDDKVHLEFSNTGEAPVEEQQPE